MKRISKKLIMGAAIVALATPATTYAGGAVTGSSMDIDSGASELKFQLEATSGVVRLTHTANTTVGDYPVSMIWENFTDRWQFRIRSGASNGRLELVRFPGSSQVMTWDPNGFVGINTNIPARPLDVRDPDDDSARLRFQQNGGNETELSLDDASQSWRMQIEGDDDLNFFSSTGSTDVMQLSTNGDVTVDGTLSTAILEIRGGADLAESFKVNTSGAEIKQGMLVSIDVENPGEMKLSSKAYDRTVAGILSGANNLDAGIHLGDAANPELGERAVALTGQAWCYVDQSAGDIMPGDLLTTSAVPGHAMKVTDYAKAQGAVVGKAMTTVNEQGMVLVLVNLH